MPCASEVSEAEGLDPRRQTGFTLVSDKQSSQRLRLAPGIEIVALGDQRFLLRSDFVAMELSGAAAVDLVDRVLRDFEQSRTADDIVLLLSDYRPAGVRDQIDELVAQGVLTVTADSKSQEPFQLFLDEIGLGASVSLDRLAQQNVGIFGLEAHGAQLAVLLADAGIGGLTLVDPYPFDEVHRSLTLIHGAPIGRLRQDVVADHVRRDGESTVVVAPIRTEAALDRGAVADTVAACDIVIACWDRGMSACNHWVNEAAVASGVPALYSELRATSCFAGPFVFPQRSACYMCSRMRSLACEDDFASAMALEEHHDRERRPALGERPMLPILPSHLSTVLGLEVLRYLLRLNQPRLVDRVLELDALAFETTSHSVLVEPACPVCGKKNSANISTGSSLASRPTLSSMSTI